MNLDHLDWPTSGWGYLPPITDVFTAFTFVEEIAHPRNILEIGFHAGHSTSYMLEIFPNSHVTTYGVSTVSLKAASYMKEHYKDRITVHRIESQTIKLSDYDGFDFALIDGNHTYDIALQDLELTKGWRVPYVLVDNCERESVAQACDACYNGSDYNLLTTFKYFSQWNNKPQWNQLRLYHVQPDSIQST